MVPCVYLSLLHAMKVEMQLVVNSKVHQICMLFSSTTRTYFYSAPQREKVINFLSTESLVDSLIQFDGENPQLTSMWMSGKVYELGRYSRNKKEHLVGWVAVRRYPMYVDCRQSRRALVKEMPMLLHEYVNV